MKKNKSRKECGMVAVEATIILPIAILSVILLLCLSIMMFQKANLQASLETALVYYKNSLTDTFVTRNDTLDIETGENEEWIASGNSYKVEAPLNPYRGIFGVSADIENEENFRKYFESVAGKMLFDDNIDLDIQYTNYGLFKQIKVTAIQNIENPLSLLGQVESFNLTATARVNVVDHDGLIRDADFAIDLIEDTKIGEYAQKFAGKISELYNTMKEKLGVE